MKRTLTSALIAVSLTTATFAATTTSASAEATSEPPTNSDATNATPQAVEDAIAKLQNPKPQLRIMTRTTSAGMVMRTPLPGIRVGDGE
jgi:hypothetical protein